MDLSWDLVESGKLMEAFVGGAALHLLSREGAPGLSQGGCRPEYPGHSWELAGSEARALEGSPGALGSARLPLWNSRPGDSPLPWWPCPRPQAPCPQDCAVPPHPHPGRQGTPAHLQAAVAGSAGGSSLAPGPHKGRVCSVQLLSSLINELPLALRKQVGVGGQAARHLLWPGVHFLPLVLGPDPEGRGDCSPTMGVLLQAQAARRGPGEFPMNWRPALHHRPASGVAGSAGVGWSLGASKPPRG